MNKLADFRESPLAGASQEDEGVPLHDRLDVPVRFISNPWYDKVFSVLLDKPLPPKQTKAKTRNRQFERSMHETLCALEKRDGMPFTEPVLVVFSVSGPKEYIEHADVDNMCKTLLDCMKGHVFVDDRQVFQLFIYKYVRDLSGWSVAIKRISMEASSGLIPPPFFGPHPDDILDEPRHLEPFPTLNLH